MDEIFLTEEQKQKVLQEWNSRSDNPPSLSELIKVAGFENKDGRSKEGRAVKHFLATRKIKAHGAHEYQPKKKIDLSDEDKEFTVNNMAFMKPMEIARVVFKDSSITVLHQETRTINEYIKSLGPEIEAYQDPEEIPDKKYKPPNTFDRLVARINKYVHHGINKDKISPKQKKEIKSLMGYLNTYRFIHQINHFGLTSDRDLFESSFIRYCHDKFDLTQEEVDQYIVLSTEVVIASSIQGRVEHLRNLLDDTANDTEGRRISMSLVEAISSAQTEYNQCVNRQQKLLESLKEKRSDKLKKQFSDNASILNLIEMWKDEESRKRLLNLAELRKKTIKDEIDNLTNMDEVKARVMGLTEDEAIN
tara:strand:- start:81 stop:1166 length:1086 start_codon:yes stop_codon:yes gene_type:complete